jgi:hypothetical protein
MNNRIPVRPMTTPSRVRSAIGPHLATAVAVTALAMHAAPARAQPTTPTPTPPPTPAEAPAPADAPGEPVGSAIGVQLNLDFTTGYFYRGIVQEDSGLIVQPAARVTVNLLESEALKLDAFVGAWNSFHGQKTGSRTHGDFSEYWYEADLLGGVTLTRGKLALTTSYTFLTSPNDAFETVQELGFTLALDDSEWLGAWAMKPYATLAFETGADASDGADSDTGTYLELGIGPGFSFDAGKTPVTITFPASVGLSLSDYYQDSAGDDETFGFAQIGVRASVPLGEPGRYGAWTLGGGVALLLLGDHTSDYNAGDDAEVIATVGVQGNF